MSSSIPVRGKLEERDFTDILRSVLRARKTGILRITQGRIGKTVYISEGRLIFATSTDPDDRLGEMLLRKGRITYRVLEESVSAIRLGKRQGTILVENGAIRSRDLIEGVTEQVQEIIYGLFPTREGEFEFVEGNLPSREVIVLRMSTADLIMEGIRRVGTWSRIRRGVGDLGQQYALSAEAARIISGMNLAKDEVSLIATVDGTVTLEEICDASPLTDFVVCRTVWGLWAAGVLDRIPQDCAVEKAVGTQDKTEPHVEPLRGASVGREIDRFNELHRFVFELVRYELRDGASSFFERAFARATIEQGALFEGVAVDATGELDPIALRRNIASREILAYPRALDRLIEIEVELARQVLGERKTGIIQDGLLELKENQLQSVRPMPR